jgi:hypothetical protein
LGAQVALTGGRSEKPDSSWKMIHAPRRLALFYPRPLLLDPNGDRLVVALPRAPRRPLLAPAQPFPQDGPRLRRPVTDPGHPLDHLRHPGQRPHLGRVAVRLRTLDQRGLNLSQLLVGQLRPATGATSADQRGPAAGQPHVVPPGCGRLRDPQLRRHVHLTLATTEHVRCLHAPLPQRLEVPARAHPLRVATLLLLVR